MKSGLLKASPGDRRRPRRPRATLTVANRLPYRRAAYLVSHIATKTSASIGFARDHSPILSMMEQKACSLWHPPVTMEPQLVFHKLHYHTAATRLRTRLTALLLPTSTDLSAPKTAQGQYA